MRGGLRLTDKKDSTLITWAIHRGGYPGLARGFWSSTCPWLQATGRWPSVARSLDRPRPGGKGSYPFTARSRTFRRCGRCVEVCPVDISPALITLAVEKNLFEFIDGEDVNLCTECGLCAYLPGPSPHDRTHAGSKNQCLTPPGGKYED